LTKTERISQETLVAKTAGSAKSNWRPGGTFSYFPNVIIPKRFAPHFEWIDLLVSGSIGFSRGMDCSRKAGSSKVGDRPFYTLGCDMRDERKFIQYISRVLAQEVEEHLLTPSPPPEVNQGPIRKRGELEKL
jgi:hypothetical protein